MAEYKAIPPDQRAYGQYSPQYAQYLATPTGDVALDNSRGGLLRNLSSGEQGAYLTALDAANKSQLAGQAGNNQTDITTHAIDQVANATNAGVGPVLGSYLPNADTSTLAPASTVQLDKAAGQGYLSRAQGLEALTKAGFAPTPENVSNTMAGPLDANPTPYLQYANPNDVAGGMTAQANMKKAEAADYLAHHPPAHGGAGIGAGGEVITMTDNGIGMPPTIVIKSGKGQDASSVAAALDAARHQTAGGDQGDRRPGSRGGWEKDAHGKLHRVKP